MKNIDHELIEWAVDQIKNKYPNDIALLIGQVGACKIPNDEQNMAFDFFVPITGRGNQLGQSFVIEEMGYDLYPISWERLQKIVDLKEPRMIFAFMKGEVIYARTEEEKKRYYDMKAELNRKLLNHKLTFEKSLEFLNTAMDIYKTMMFEDSLCKVRKAAGGISCYLMNAIAMINGRYLENGYNNLSIEMEKMISMPDNFSETYHYILKAKTVQELQENSHLLIKITRDYFIDKKPYNQEQERTDNQINYDDMADWYQEARYTFRKIEYYAKTKSIEDCFLLGCYLQIEFDSIVEEFDLKSIDLLGAFDGNQLVQFAYRAKAIEDYVLSVLKQHNAETKIYKNLDGFLAAHK